MFEFSVLFHVWAIQMIWIKHRCIQLFRSTNLRRVYITRVLIFKLEDLVVLTDLDRSRRKDMSLVPLGVKSS